MYDFSSKQKDASIRTHYLWLCFRLEDALGRREIVDNVGDVTTVECGA